MYQVDSHIKSVSGHTYPPLLHRESFVPLAGQAFNHKPLIRGHAFLLPFLGIVQRKHFCFISDCPFSKFSHHLTPLQVFSAILFRELTKTHEKQSSWQARCCQRGLSCLLSIFGPKSFSRSKRSQANGHLGIFIQALCQPAEEVARSHRQNPPGLLSSPASSFGDPSTDSQHHTMAL